MKRYLVTEKETGCLIDEFDSIEDAKEAIAFFEDMDKSSGDYCDGFYEIIEEETVVVNYYSANIRYTGRIEDYSDDELLNMAREAQTYMANFDCEREAEMCIDDARKIDGAVKIGKIYEQNHICCIEWAEICEEN